jgi:hypothetical protein
MNRFQTDTLDFNEMRADEDAGGDVTDILFDIVVAPPPAVEAESEPCRGCQNDSILFDDGASAQRGDDRILIGGHHGDGIYIL